MQASIASNISFYPAQNKQQQTTIRLSSEARAVADELPYSTLNKTIEALLLAIGRQRRDLPGVGPRSIPEFLNFLGVPDVDIPPEYRWTAQERLFERDKVRGWGNCAPVDLVGRRFVSQEEADQTHIELQEKKLQAFIIEKTHELYQLPLSDAARLDVWELEIAPLEKKLEELDELTQEAKRREEAKHQAWLHSEERARMYRELDELDELDELRQVEGLQAEKSPFEERKPEAPTLPSIEESTPYLVALVAKALFLSPGSLKVALDDCKSLEALEARIEALVELYSDNPENSKRRKFPWLI